MDQHGFDRLARAFSASPSRRHVLWLVSVLPLLALRPGRADAQAATPAVPCPEGLSLCAESGACVDLATDLANCGACGSVCESGLVAVACRGGECVRADCPEGIEYCGAIALCRDLSVDPEHCGACGHACAAGAACVAGQCAPRREESCSEDNASEETG